MKIKQMTLWQLKANLPAFLTFYGIVLALSVTLTIVFFSPILGRRRRHFQFRGCGDRRLFLSSVVGCSSFRGKYPYCVCKRRFPQDAFPELPDFFGACQRGDSNIRGRGRRSPQPVSPRRGCPYSATGLEFSSCSSLRSTWP